MKAWRQPVTPDETASILRLHHVEGWPVGTIGAQIGRHHDTIEGVLAHASLGVQKQMIRTRLVDPFLPFVKETLEKYPRLRSGRLWSMAKARGYIGSKSGFRAIIRRLRPRPHAEAFLRRAVLPGQEAQVDWAHFGKLTVRRATRDLWAFVMVLSYSRRRFVRFSLRAAMPSFLREPRERFASCIVPRTKTGEPQRLDIPDVLQAPLRRWWVTHERPTSGPVFPVTRGKRKGEARHERGVSFADRLRRNLMVAGVKRHPCARPEVRPTEQAACCPELGCDPIYKETGWSLPVDFHSFRRAFSTGLAEAGVNAQQAMVLAGHADPRAHAPYIMETQKLARIPDAALLQATPGWFCHSPEG